jgi:hypothetical protein
LLDYHELWRNHLLYNHRLFLHREPIIAPSPITAPLTDALSEIIASGKTTESSNQTFLPTTTSFPIIAYGPTCDFSPKITP